MDLDLRALRVAVTGTAAAFRSVTDYQPAGGRGDKVVFRRLMKGESTLRRIGLIRRRAKCGLASCWTPCSRKPTGWELALLEAHRASRVALPLLVTRFDQEELPRKFAVSSLEAPHCIADALFRDSLLNGVMFRESNGRPGAGHGRRPKRRGAVRVVSTPWCSACGIQRGRVAG